MTHLMSSAALEALLHTVREHTATVHRLTCAILAPLVAPAAGPPAVAPDLRPAVPSAVTISQPSSPVPAQAARGTTGPATVADASSPVGDAAIAAAPPTAAAETTTAAAAPRRYLPTALVTKALTVGDGIMAPAHLLPPSGVRLLGLALLWQLAEPTTTATLGELLARELALDAEGRPDLLGKLAKELNRTKSERDPGKALVGAEKSGKGRELRWSLTARGIDWVMDLAGDLL